MVGHVVFRTDSALRIGSGHVMRCLSLADELRALGANCSFITRAHTGHIASTVEARGYLVHLLAQAAEPNPPDDWLGADLATECAQARPLLDALQPDWIVLDHYGLGAEWTHACVPHGARIAILDDLADRAQQGALLIDQTLGRMAEDYAALTGENMVFLTGTGNALLHRKFASLRAQRPPRRFEPGVGKVLLALGGMDSENVTSQVLARLAEVQRAIGLSGLDVVLGATAPHQEQVRDALAAFPTLPATLHVGIPHMELLMAEADLAIGAGGTMLWERCCLGLPTVALSLAENQEAGLQAAADKGALMRLPENWEPALGLALHTLADPDTRAAMSSEAAALVDGLGCKRAAVAMIAQSLTSRRVTTDDTIPIYDWRLSGVDPNMTLSGNTPSLDEHRAWMMQALADPKRLMWMIARDGDTIGHVRCDVTEPRTARVSLLMNPVHRGTGLAAPVLWLALVQAQRQGITRFTAEIHCDNTASHHVFAQLGFTPSGTQDAFTLYAAQVGDAGLPQIHPSAQEI